MSIDLNCDLGEGEAPQHTRELMRWISSANIACGGHAGDKTTMRRCVELALEHGVNIGAHPGPVDRVGKGRGKFSLDRGALRDLIEPQVNALKSIAENLGTNLHHLKLHGALYHAVESDDQLAGELVELVASNWPDLKIIAFAGGRVINAAMGTNVDVWAEAFADRAYQPDGKLVPRTHANAVLNKPTEIIARVARLISEGRLETNHGADLQLKIDTICVHSDSDHSTEMVRRLSDLLGSSAGPSSS